MGGDGQPQIHLQVLSELVDRGQPLQAALDAPRFLVDVADGSVSLEGRVPDELLRDLTDRGHAVATIDPYDHRVGHAHAIEVTAAGYVGGSDPRCEGAVSGH
jgi:gamma-glutamyltranspeptidase